MKTFVCDMDGCLLDTTAGFAKKWSEILGVEIRPKHFNSWKHEWAFGIDPKLNTRFWAEIWDVPVKPYIGAEIFIRTIKSVGYDFVLLTSRPNKESVAALYRDMKPLLPYIDDVMICNQSKGDRKSDYVNKLADAEYFLDDHIKNVVDVKLNSPQLKEVFLYDRPWNTSLDIVRYRRMFSYTDIVSVLLQESE